MYAYVSNCVTKAITCTALELKSTRGHLRRKNAGYLCGLGSSQSLPEVSFDVPCGEKLDSALSNHKKKYRNIPNLTTSPIHGSKKSWRCVHFTIILCVSKVLYLVSFLSTAAIFFLLCWIVTASWKLQPFSFNCKAWI